MLKLLRYEVEIQCAVNTNEKVVGHSSAIKPDGGRAIKRREVKEVEVNASS